MRIQPKQFRRTVVDPNKLGTEGRIPPPWHCHDYPDPPKQDPGLTKRINVAIYRMECACEPKT